MLDWILGLDKEAFLFLNSKNSPMWDQIMWWISAKITWIPLYVVLLVVLIRNDLSFRVIITLLFIAVTVVLCDQISVLLKNMIERLRPSHVAEFKEIIHLVINPKTGVKYTGGQYGFVSSHAANVFGVATIIASQLKNFKWGLFLFSWAIIVSYSRIYLGVHYPLDIICGALLGTLIGIHLYVLKTWTLSYIDIKLKERQAKKRRQEKLQKS